MDMNIAQEPASELPFELPTGMLAGIDIPARLQADFPDSPHAFSNRAYRGLPQRTARVKEEILTRLEQIEFVESAEFGPIHSLCKNYRVGGGIYESPISPQLWKNCSQQVLDRLAQFNPSASLEVLRADVAVLMGVAGSIITSDLSHFRDQAAFFVTIAQDKIAYGDRTYAPSWHTDPFLRHHLMRTKRTGLFFNPQLFLSTNSLCQEDVYRDLLKMAEEKLPKDETRKWNERFKDRVSKGQFRLPGFAPEIAGDVTLLAKWMDTLWQPRDGVVATTDMNSPHISIIPKPGVPAEISTLIGVGVERSDFRVGECPYLSASGKRLALAESRL